MNTKNILAFAILLAVSGMQSQETKNSSKNIKKPNIVFILADDMGYNELGSYGGKIIETPNIDKHGVEQFESTFYIQNTILNVGMETRLKGKRQQKDVIVNVFFPYHSACS